MTWENPTNQEQQRQTRSIGKPSIFGVCDLFVVAAAQFVNVAENYTTIVVPKEKIISF